MTPTVFFTQADRVIIDKAASLAERLTVGYFGLAENEWKRSPYGIFTRRDVNSTLYESDVFANVIRLKGRPTGSSPEAQREKYGILLQDPNILLALLRSERHDLWTLGLFVLTHELVHIIRFQKYQVDFFASPEDRDEEEQFVQGVTRRILAGVTNTDHVLSLYDREAGLASRQPNFQRASGR
jgi:hypothetical protein